MALITLPDGTELPAGSPTRGFMLLLRTLCTWICRVGGCHNISVGKLGRHIWKRDAEVALYL